jgi:hypothetical protein
MIQIALPKSLQAKEDSDGNTIITLKRGSEYPNYEVREWHGKRFNLFLNESETEWCKISPHGADGAKSTITHFDKDDLESHIASSFIIELNALGDE